MRKAARHGRPRANIYEFAPHTIDRGQIRDSLPRAIADQDLMLEQQRLCGDREDQQIAHDSNVITSAELRKTAEKGRLALRFANSPPTGLGLPKLEH